MRLGLFMMPLHGLGRSLGDTLAEDRQAIVLADRLGFDEAWVGEHLTASTEPITSPLIFLASLLQEAKRIRLGPGVLALPHHHPATLAGHCALFDHLSDGRLMLGIGPGGLASDQEMFGVLGLTDRGERMMESIDMMLAIWGGEPPWRFEGKYWQFAVEKSLQVELGIGPMLKPVQQPHPPIAISVLGYRTGLAHLAGENGWSPISANFVPAEVLASHWSMYKDGCAKVGRNADPAHWRVARSVLVTPTDGEAIDYLAKKSSGLQFYYRYLCDQLCAAGTGRNFKIDPDMADADLTDDYLLNTMVIAGSPTTVADKINALRDKLGPFGTLLVAAHDWDDKAMWTRSLELMVGEVWGRLRH
jgi:alkanesulfonate monooxygenase SsuD/methylene tetrahydromethanopterin reductase-like flavin-dependent oxidoreductase (luciferase family)